MAGKRSSSKSKSRRPKKIKKRASAARKSKSGRSSRPKARTRSRPKARAKSRPKARVKAKRSARPKSKRAAAKRPVHRTAAKRPAKATSARASKQPALKQVGGGQSFQKIASPGGGTQAKLGMRNAKMAGGGEGAPQGLLEFEDGPPPTALRDPSLGPPPMPKKRRKGSPVNMLDYPGESLTVGMPAPEFSLPSTLGRRVTLSEFRGKRVILYFYPKDDTPGCTMEACGFRDSFPRIESKDAIVLGVSLDDELSHERFAQKFSLPFPLLSDKDAAVSRQYGTYKEKNLYGRSFWGIERTTFVIDREGKVEHVFRRVKVEGHAEEVMATLAL